MPKQNVLNFTGIVTEVSGHQFLQDGAEVMTIVLEWFDDDYRQEAAVGLYSKKGFPDKFKNLNIAKGDKVMIPCQPNSKVKEGVSEKGPWRMWNTTLRGDSWKAEVLEKAAPQAEPIPFPGEPA